MAKAATAKRKKITLVETDKSIDELRAGSPKQKFQAIDIVVRGPDRKLKDVAGAASLCSCRRICVAIVET